MFRILGYTGIGYSSPTLASMISNLTPGFTFTLAIIFRFVYFYINIFSKIFMETLLFSKLIIQNYFLDNYTKMKYNLIIIVYEHNYQKKEENFIIIFWQIINYNNAQGLAITMCQHPWCFGKVWIVSLIFSENINSVPNVYKSF